MPEFLLHSAQAVIMFDILFPLLSCLFLVLFIHGAYWPTYKNVI